MLSSLSADLKIGRRRLAGAPAILGVTLLAFALRAIYLVRAWPNPALQLPLIDARAYRDRGLEIAGGDWVGTGVYYLDPLYPYFLALVYSVVPPNTVYVLLAQGLLDSASVAVLMLIARRVFDDRAALVAGGIAATYKLFFFYDGLLLKAPVMIFLMVVALYFVTRAVERGAPDMNAPDASIRPLMAWVPAGFFLGLFALTRGNSLLFVPALALWILLFGAREHLLIRRTLLGRRILAILFLGIGLAGALLPVGFRNYAVGGDFVLLNSQGGQNFYIGHFRKNQTGTYLAPPFLRPNPDVEESDFAAEAARLTGRDDLQPSEISSFWLQKGFEEIAADPGQFLRHTVRKALVFANHYEIPDNASYEYFQKHVSSMLNLPFPTYAAVLPFALAGMFLAIRRPMAQVLILFFFAYASGLLIFFNLSRMRLPVVPVAILFAGFALVQLWSFARARDLRRLAAPLLIVLVMIPVTQLDLVYQELSIRYFNLGTGFERVSNEHWYRHEALREEGKEKSAHAEAEAALTQRLYAEEQFQLGLSSFPDYKRLQNQLRDSILTRVLQLETMGRDKAVVQAALQLIRAFPDFPPGYARLGLAYERQGQYNFAAQSFRRTLQLMPNNQAAKAGLQRIRNRNTPE